MKRFRTLWILIPALVLQGCPFGSGYKYNTGTFPSEPVNFTEINTEFDDFNADTPIFGETFPLCFSSNRSSSGADFDIVYKLINIEFSRSTGDLSIAEEKHQNYDVVSSNRTLYKATQKVNSPYDELGPFIIPTDDNFWMESGYLNTYFMLYSNEENGKQDIRFTHNTINGAFEDPRPVIALNSDAHDAYPSFNPERTAIYFCSDRDENFDIYRASCDPDMELLDLLNSDSLPIEKDSILSSERDDKCPYIAHGDREYIMEGIVNNMLVFASNREGGYGGFDLYYSLLENGNWTEPVNFGAGINTEFDEYRPIVRPQYSFTNDFMIFSSNRPGGVGGFDLYYVGIPDIGDPYPSNAGNGSKK